ncbi:MAG: M48 family metallopeptidase, partial [Parvularcula sp.]|nr:M48 family metallopeptidase [Parvularcula sp.]
VFLPAAEAGRDPRLRETLSQGLRVLAAAALAIALLFGLSTLAAPAAFRLAVALTPFSIEDSIGQSTLVAMDGNLLSASEVDPDRQAVVAAQYHKVLDAYAARADARPEPSFSLLFRESEALGANAIALPSGQVIITDRFLELVEDDEAIATVLAHEVAHVHYRHSLYKLYRGLALEGVSMLLGGQAAHYPERGLVQAAFLANLASSRAMERQADELSVDLALAAGIPPFKLSEALNVLTADCEECVSPSWLSTHPAVDDRVQRIDKLIKER